MRPRAPLGAFAAVLALLAAAAAAPAAGRQREIPELPPPLAEPADPPWLVPDPSPLGPAPSFEEQVLELVNEERWANGQLPPLKGQAQLAAAAELHSTNMGVRNFFSHCDLDTLTLPWDRMIAAGYSWSAAAENAAAGQPTPVGVVAAWMASSGHRANILSTGYRELGVGYYLDSGDTGNVRHDLDANCVPETGNSGPYFRYWTQNFGRRNTVYPVVIDREAYSTAGTGVDLYLYGAGWAQEMRIRNSSGAFTSWMPFASDVPWTLTAAGGTKTVIVEIRNGATVRTASDSIVLDQPLVVLFGDGFESGDTSSWSATVQ